MLSSFSFPNSLRCTPALSLSNICLVLHCITHLCVRSFRMWLFCGISYLFTMSTFTTVRGIIFNWYCETFSCVKPIPMLIFFLGSIAKTLGIKDILLKLLLTSYIPELVFLDMPCQKILNCELAMGVYILVLFYRLLFPKYTSRTISIRLYIFVSFKTFELALNNHSRIYR